MPKTSLRLTSQAEWRLSAAVFRMRGPVDFFDEGFEIDRSNKFAGSARAHTCEAHPYTFVEHSPLLLAASCPEQHSKLKTAYCAAECALKLLSLDGAIHVFSSFASPTASTLVISQFSSTDEARRFFAIVFFQPVGRTSLSCGLWFLMLTCELSHINHSIVLRTLGPALCNSFVHARQQSPGHGRMSKGHKRQRPGMQQCSTNSGSFWACMSYSWSTKHGIPAQCHHEVLRTGSWNLRERLIPAKYFCRAHPSSQ